ncbi:hypothetical protein CsSME_00016535 [Camellia sinensis var. sinensis]
MNIIFNLLSIKNKKAKQSSPLNFLSERFVTCGSQSLETTEVSFLPLPVSSAVPSTHICCLAPTPYPSLTLSSLSLFPFLFFFVAVLLLLAKCKHKLTSVDGFVKAIWVRCTISFKPVAWVSL